MIASRQARLFAVLILLGIAPHATAQALNGSARLTIDGEAYNVPVGKAFAVRINGERVTVRIDPQTAREFKAAGVSFRYPIALETSQPEAGEGVQIWTFQGDTVAVMLQRYDPALAPAALRDTLVETLRAKSDAKPQPVKLTGADRAYNGTQIRTRSPARDGAPATTSVQNLFTFANDEGVFALIVQDFRPPGDGDSSEYTTVLRLLSESLTTGELTEEEPPAAEAAADETPSGGAPPQSP